MRVALALAMVIVFLATAAGFITATVFLLQGDRGHWAVFEVISLCLFASLLFLGMVANVMTSRM